MILIGVRRGQVTTPFAAGDGFDPRTRFVPPSPGTSRDRVLKKYGN